MNIFKIRILVDRDSGKEVQSYPDIVARACDYCGVIHDDNDQFEVAYQPRHIGGAEPHWHEDRVLTPDGQRIDVNSIVMNHPEFHYCQSWDMNKWCEKRMIWTWVRWMTSGSQSKDFKFLQEKARQEWKELQIGPSEEMLSRSTMIAHVMHEFRYAVIHKLLKTYSLEHLQLEIC